VPRDLSFWKMIFQPHLEQKRNEHETLLHFTISSCNSCLSMRNTLPLKCCAHSKQKNICWESVASSLPNMIVGAVGPCSSNNFVRLSKNCANLKRLTAGKTIAAEFLLHDLERKSNVGIGAPLVSF
jgi:hypothetical protein